MKTSNKRGALWLVLQHNYFVGVRTNKSRGGARAFAFLLFLIFTTVASPANVEKLDTSASATSQGDETGGNALEVRDRSLLASRVANRLLPFEPTYMAYQWTDGDENAVEARLSFKYLITRPECSTYEIAPESDCKFGLETFFAFSGEFDFYLGTRPSDPFLPRFLNPSLHLNKNFYIPEDKTKPFKERYLDASRLSVRYVGIAVQHMSNGQSIEPVTTVNGIDQPFRDSDGLTLSDRYALNPGDDIFDQVGHGLSFVSLQAGLRLGRPQTLDPNTGRCVRGCTDLTLQWNPVVFTDDNLINWGPNNGVDEVMDYFRYRAKFTKALRTKFREDFVLSGTWTFGDAGLDDSSFDVSVSYPVPIWLKKRKRATKSKWKRDAVVTLQAFFEYHNGPMATLADYSRSLESWSLGLKFGGI